MQGEVKNIVVLGAGYGGLMATLRLAGKTKRHNSTVTLVNGLDHFVERPRLHEQATGTRLKHWPLRPFLAGSGATFLQGWVTAIDPERRCVSVQTSAGLQQLPYTILVNALGSSLDKQAVPGVKEYAFTLDPYGDLTTTGLASKLAGYADQPFQAVVVGGGATGIETATQLKSTYRHGQVLLVSQGEVGAFKGPKVQQHILQALAEQSIKVVEHAAVTAVEKDSVVLGSERIRADIIIWAGGFVASPIAAQAGLRVNARNQMLVDPTLRALSQPNIYGVGDAAATVEEPGAPLRMSLFTALVSGAQAADNIAAEIKGKMPQPLSYAWYGQGIALGTEDAIGFATYPADVAWNLIFRRKLAVRVRNFFVWYLGFALRMERRLPGLFYWNGKKRYSKQQQHKQRKEMSRQKLTS